MKCMKCGVNEATYFLKENINGNVKELSLCPECAKDFYKPGFVNFNYNDLLSSFFGGKVPLQNEARQQKKVCDFCGADLGFINKTGKVGCAKCYEVFLSELTPFIQNIHGSRKHKGKAPGVSGAKSDIQLKIEKLKKQLSEAIQKQEYEQAAVLRDKIIALEKGADKDDGEKRS